MQSKTNFYQPNGTGRDKYISVDSGGQYYPNRVKPEYPVSSFYSKSVSQPLHPSSANKVVRYTTDGSGRDSYIMTNSGGFELAGRKKFALEGQLRNYPKTCKAGSWVNRGYRTKMKQLKMHQDALTLRLSCPKYV